MADLDPFTQVYDALWAMLEARAGITKMVRLKNRIKFTGSNRDPIKDQISYRDLPEMILVPGTGIPHLQRTSNSSSMLETLEIRVATGDQRIGEILYPLKWEVYRALSTWETLLLALTWNSKTFVRLVRPTSVQDGVAQADLNRGIKGWSTLWACEYEMWFATADLQGA